MTAVVDEEFSLDLLLASNMSNCMLIKLAFCVNFQVLFINCFMPSGLSSIVLGNLGRNVQGRSYVSVFYYLEDCISID